MSGIEHTLNQIWPDVQWAVSPKDQQEGDGIADSLFVNTDPTRWAFHGTEYDHSLANPESSHAADAQEETSRAGATGTNKPLGD